jgi:hypothetical protein
MAAGQFDLFARFSPRIVGRRAIVAMIVTRIMNPISPHSIPVSSEDPLRADNTITPVNNEMMVVLGRIRWNLTNTPAAYRSPDNRAVARNTCRP